MDLTLITSVPGTSKYEERTFTSFKEVCEFIGGRLYCLHLPNEIDIWMNALMQQSKSSNSLNGCVIDEADQSYENCIYGNLFFAGRGEYGGTVNLTEEQKAWIYENTERPADPTKPFNFRLKVEMEVA